MLIGSRSGFIGNGLPYDREVEYLESTGTQWIDTGIVLNSDTGFEIHGNMLGPIHSSAPVLAGINIPDSWIAIWEEFGDVTVEVYTKNYDSYVYTSIDTEFVASINYMLDGVVKTNPYVDTSSREVEMFDTGLNVALFCAMELNGPGSFSTSRIYSCKISKGTQIVRDFHPVRIGATGYMYDKISGQLFGNQGTGSFILGPDKVGGGGNLLKLWFEAFYAEPSEEKEAA